MEVVLLKFRDGGRGYQRRKDIAITVGYVDCRCAVWCDCCFRAACVMGAGVALLRWSW